MPDYVVIGVDFDKFVAIAAGDNCVSVGESIACVWVAFYLDCSDYFSVGIVFSYNAVGVVAYEVVSILEFSCDSHLGVGFCLVGCEFYGFEDFSFAVDFYYFAWARYCDHVSAVGEGLAGVDFVWFLGFVLPDDFFVTCDFLYASVPCEEDVAICKLPDVLGTFDGVFPFDIAGLGGYANHVASVVGAYEGVRDWFVGEWCGFGATC